MHETNLGQFPLAQAWNSSANGCFISYDDGSLNHFDTNSQSLTKFATHTSPLLQVANIPQHNCILAIDNEKGLLAYATNGGSKTAPDFLLRFREQPFSFSIDGSTLLMSLSHNKLAFIDISRLNYYNANEISLVDSQLNAPLSTVCIADVHKEFYLGSSDGRVYKGVYNVQQPQHANAKPTFTAVHQPDSNSPTPTFTFLGQARKRPNDQRSDLYHISALGRHPSSRQFIYTAGSDGLLNFWDIKERNKIASFSAPGPISCCDISADGQMLAFGVGYDWSQGLWGLPDVNYPPTVGFKSIAPHELSFKKA